MAPPSAKAKVAVNRISGVHREISTAEVLLKESEKKHLIETFAGKIMWTKNLIRTWT